MPHRLLFHWAKPIPKGEKNVFRGARCKGLDRIPTSGPMARRAMETGEQADDQPGSCSGRTEASASLPQI